MNTKGLLPAVLIVALIVLAGAAALFYRNEAGAGYVAWDYNREGFGWKPDRTPPECPVLALESPVDVSLVTSVLYPGQYRGETVNAGDDYKVHGGFRFDGQETNDIEVRSPTDGYVWRGTRYLANGELQYAFDVVDPCGIMHRFGHMLAVSPAFQALADSFPEPRENDSRTTETPRMQVRKGDLIATKVGLAGNVFVDWGVYDLRKENEASRDPAYRTKHYALRWFAYHGLCWLDYLPADAAARLRALPGADLKVGKTSDYCVSR